jgi:type IV secretion system protein VirB10
MFEQTQEAPVADEERRGLVERPRMAPPGQKLILVVTSSVAVAFILFGIASRHNFFGLFGAPVPPKVIETQGEGRPVTAPEVKVPLETGLFSNAPTHVECPGGLRLPIGLNCPEPEKRTEAAPTGAPNAMSEEDRVRERRLKSTIALATSTSGAAPATSLGNAGSPVGLAGASMPSGGSNALAGSLSATITPSTRATINRQPSMTLAKGTLPDCTLLTAILTDQPGFLKCILSAPVMSMDGKVVLMETGTTLEGEYTQGLQAGQRTIFTLWTRAVTPNFVSVPLNSPGTDALGRAGTSGQIDHKWFERFAGAVFFSLFEDAKQIYIARDSIRAAQAANASGDTYNIGTQGTLSQWGNTGSTTKSIVEEMLKQGSQVRPSLAKNQGEIIKVFVARDVDFSSVYELRPAAATP